MKLFVKQKRRYLFQDYVSNIKIKYVLIKLMQKELARKREKQLYFYLHIIP